MQRRSEAIKNALNRYNTQAAKLNPPRPALTWKEIVDYSFIGEFDALRHARADIRDQPWTHTARREATSKYFKLCRAREEITRLDVEIRRLRASIQHEATHYEKVISQLSSSNPSLATELCHVWQLRNAVNRLHLQRLDAVEKSARSPYLASNMTTDTATDMEQCTSVNEGSVNVEDGLVEAGDIEEALRVEEGSDELEKITDFVLTLTD